MSCRKHHSKIASRDLGVYDKIQCSSAITHSWPSAAGPEGHRFPLQDQTLKVIQIPTAKRHFTIP